MTRDNKSKQDQINAMENLLQREAEKHQEMLRLLEDEHATQKQQAGHEIEVLRRQVCQLELHVEAYDVLEAANGKLRDRVEELMQEMEQENKTHAEEIHKVRLDMFNHKMALEKTFRKALQELDADYLKKAFNAMSEESKKRCNKWKSRCMELTEREATRRMDEQRAKTAPTAVTALSSMIRVQSQPAFSPHATPTMSFTARDKGPTINYDEMWSHSFALRTNQQSELPFGFVDKIAKKKKKQVKGALQQTEGETGVAPGSEESIEQLNRIANSELDMVSTRATSSQTARRKTHRLAQTIIPRKGQSVDAFNFAS
ncbi:hypothetical protein AM588_10006066 [Phytophthora nicotianae]|uniref:Uncharacterized protein n=1 Tax=Phytophthora nicotianae TaxID=4792 RepID=A0A0W8D0E3_PHYNI|nr:hypothetical protein AM588_10006066 [Phytophthora nicotianae]